MINLHDETRGKGARRPRWFVRDRVGEKKQNQVENKQCRKNNAMSAIEI